MNGRTNRAARAGFSLLELMLVVALIGVLMAVVAWNLMGTSTTVKTKASYTSMNMIRNAVRTYQVTNSSYPANLLVLTAGPTPLLSTDFKLADGWGHDFLYQAPGSNGREFDLFSKGADGVFGTADDLSVWDTANQTGH
jgi:general secretion pathway protein G